MMLHVPEVLTPAELARCREVLGRAPWEDGRATAGHQSARVKQNLQLPQASAEARELGELVLAALGRSATFGTAALPQRVLPPLFNRYEGGGTFGAHVDNALRTSPLAEGRIRTDISGTLFLSDPEGYEGGELVVEDTYGSHAVKLPAGDLVLYPASSLHHVTPITRGTRLASFFWVQSLVRDTTRRALLFDMEAAVGALLRETPDHPALVVLTGTYNNLLRMWADT